MRHNNGTARRRAALAREYRHFHDEEHVQRSPRHRVRMWWLGLLLPATGCYSVLAPFNLAIMLVAVLVGSLISFADYLGEEFDDATYWVVYQQAPVWLVAEDSAQVWHRRVQVDTSVAGDRFPEDYAGRVHEMIPSGKPRPTWPNEHFACSLMTLSHAQFIAAGAHTIKIDVDSDPLVFVPVTIEDRCGATLATLRENYLDADIIVAIESADPTLVEQGVIDAKSVASELLAPPNVHTGKGNYWVKTAQTSESEVQSGAPVGQVINIVGTVTVGGYTGGYVVNTTRSETRGIVSHTASSATLEGDLTNWLDTDTVVFYDCWTSFQGAFDQLATDQSTATFTAAQYVEAWNGTYTEDIDTINFATDLGFPLYVRPAAGQTAVILTNSGLSTHTLNLASTEGAIVSDLTIRSELGTQSGIYVSGGGGLWCYDVDFVDTAGTDGYGTRCPVGSYYRCTYTGLDRGHTGAGEFHECVFTDCDTYGIIHGINQMGCAAYGCTFDTCTIALAYYYSQSNPRNLADPTLINCSAYGCTYFVRCTGSVEVTQVVHCVVANCAVSGATAVYSESAGNGEVSWVEQCDYNCFYNCTNIADVGGSTYTLAQWQVITPRLGGSPDAHTITSNPGFTDPANGDFSLATSSLCRHAGIGAYAVCPTGANGVDFDKWHPDIGSWSSGAGPNQSW